MTLILPPIVGILYKSLLPRAIRASQSSTRATGRGAYFNIGGLLTNTGVGTTFTNEAGALLNAGAIQNLNGATLTNTGVFGSGDLRDLSRLSTNGLLLNLGSGTQLINQGFATLTNDFAILNQAGASLVNTDGAMLANQNGANFINTGLGTLLTNQGGAQFTNDVGSALINEQGATLRTSAVLVNDGIIQNSARFEVTDTGTVTGSGTYTQTAGALVVDGVMTQGTIICQGGGKVSGTGTNSTITNNGCTLAPGHSPGTLTIDGDLFFNLGILEIEVAGLGAGQFDVLKILGDLIFTGGTIEFDFLDGFVPKAGDLIPFLLANSITGLDKVTLTSTGLPTGTSFRLGSNGVLDIVVDGPSTGVPEPGSMLLVLVGFATLVARRRLGNRRR